MNVALRGSLYLLKAQATIPPMKFRLGMANRGSSHQAQETCSRGSSSFFSPETTAPHFGQNTDSFSTAARQTLHEYNAFPQYWQKLPSGVALPQVGQLIVSAILVHKIASNRGDVNKRGERGPWLRGGFAAGQRWCYIRGRTAAGRAAKAPAELSGREQMCDSRSLKVARDSLAVARVIRQEQGTRRAVWYFASFRMRGLGRGLLDYYSLVYSRIRRKPLIHVIGDSHAKALRGQRLFVVHHLGAATAHNLGKQNSTTKSNKKLLHIVRRLSSRDVVLTVLGEIDCRIHIYYKYKTNGERRSIGELVDDTISNYGEVLKRLGELGIRVFVFGVPPATKVRNEYGYEFYAPPEIHAEINRLFNEKLRSFCEKNGFGYIDVYSRFSDGDGYVVNEYAADEMHLDGKVAGFVREELSRQLGTRL